MKTKTILYFDLLAGAAGDMLVAALLDLQPDPQIAKLWLLNALQKLNLNETISLSIKKVQKNTISALKVDFHTPEDHWSKLTQPETQQISPPQKSLKHTHRSFRSIKTLLENTTLSLFVKKNSINAFALLAQAEAAVHNSNPHSVHFHEVGSLDAILEITSFFLLLEKLQPNLPQNLIEIYSSPLKIGNGSVTCIHGNMPVPVPAVAKLLEITNAPFQKIISPYNLGELTTPTGAALILAATQYFSFPNGVFSSPNYGYGAGQKNFKSLPNLIRISLIKPYHTPKSIAPTTPMDVSSSQTPLDVVEMKTNLDDATGEEIAYLSARLLKIGAIDVNHRMITMKKGRPGVELQILARPRQRQQIGNFLLQHSSSIGYRYAPLKRHILKRSIQKFVAKNSKILQNVIFNIKIAQPNNPLDPMSPLKIKVEDASLQQALLLPQVAQKYTYTALKKFVEKNFLHSLEKKPI